jgi:AcrR family transcriptional regulator
MSEVTTGGRPYHHGNLPTELVEAGIAAAARGGAVAVTVRDAARSVGVSAPAAYRHFADREDLVAHVARRCRERLAAAMIAARNDSAIDPHARFLAIGRAYIDFAKGNPGLIDCAFAGEADWLPDDPDAFQVLVDGLDELLAAGIIDSERRVGAEFVAWSAVHGVAMIVARSRFFAAQSEAMTDRVLLGIEHALGVRPPAEAVRMTSPD